MSLNHDIEKLLDDLDEDYGGLIPRLGDNWREIIRLTLEAAWNYGYANAINDAINATPNGGNPHP